MTWIAVGLLSATVAVAGGQGPSHAAYGIHAGTHNHQYEPIRVAKNWCGPGNQYRLYQDAVPYYENCDGTQGLGYNPSMTLYYDQQTPNQDWDAFFVDRNCVVTWALAAVGIGTAIMQHPIDRRGTSSGVWVRVKSLTTAIIRTKNCVPPGDDGVSNPPQPGTPPWEPPPPSEYQPPATLPSSMSIKRNDYNQDGVSDVVGVRASDGCLARWRGNGNGGLDYIGDYGCGWNNYTIA